MLMMIVNLLLLMVWVRLLPQRDEKLFFNPYVAMALSYADRVIGFVKPVLAWLPSYWVGVVVLGFVLVFRGVAVSATGAQWPESFGLWQFAAVVRSPSRSVLFSVVAFGWLLHRLWTLEWVLALLRGRRGGAARASEALGAWAMPVSAVPLASRGLLLLGFGAALGAAMARVGIAHGAVSGQLVQLQVSPGVLLVLGLSSLVEVLGVASRLVMVLIVLSFVGTLLRSVPAVTIANEGLDLLVGSVFRRPAMAGGINFTPVVFFIGAGILQQFALGGLARLVEAGL